MHWGNPPENGQNPLVGLKFYKIGPFRGFRFYGAINRRREASVQRT